MLHQKPKIMTRNYFDGFEDASTTPKKHGLFDILFARLYNFLMANNFLVDS